MKPVRKYLRDGKNPAIRHPSRGKKLLIKPLRVTKIDRVKE